MNSKNWCIISEVLQVTAELILFKKQLQQQHQQQNSNPFHTKKTKKPVSAQVAMATVRSKVYITYRVHPNMAKQGEDRIVLSFKS